MFKYVENAHKQHVKNGIHFERKHEKWCGMKVILGEIVPHVS